MNSERRERGRERIVPNSISLSLYPYQLREIEAVGQNGRKTVKGDDSRPAA